MKIYTISLSILVGLALLIEGVSSHQNDTILLKNGNIITMISDEVLIDTDIRIKDDTIIEVGNNLVNRVNERVIDLSGKYIMPALFDMHAHLSVENPWHPYQLSLFRYFGVHDVQFMAGNDDLLSLSYKINEDEFDSPLPYPGVYLASELIDGDPPLWGEDHNGPVLIDTTEVYSTLQSLKDKGYRDIKIYNQLSESIYLKILKEASKLDLNVTGHIPYEVKLNNRLRSQHHRIEHLEGYPDIGYIGDLEEIEKAGLFRNLVMARHVDWEKLESASRLTEWRGIWNTPTHVLFSSLLDTTYINEIWNGEYSILLDPAMKGFWSDVLSNDSTMPHLRSDEFRKWHLKMIQILHANGAKILAGTDSPLPFLLYGHSVHKELQYFVQAGMSPYEALRTATILPAKYLELTRRGKIQIGFYSELVILNSNPLENISNTLDIHSTLSGGEYIERVDFDKILIEFRTKMTE